MIPPAKPISLPEVIWRFLVQERAWVAKGRAKTPLTKLPCSHGAGEKELQVDAETAAILHDLSYTYTQICHVFDVYKLNNV